MNTSRFLSSKKWYVEYAVKHDEKKDLMDRILARTLQMVEHMNCSKGSMPPLDADSDSPREELMAGSLAALLDWATKHAPFGPGELKDSLQKIISKTEEPSYPSEVLIKDMLCRGGIPPTEMLDALERIVSKFGNRRSIQ